MIIIDCETTSPNPEVCGIASIGALYFNPQEPTYHLKHEFYDECQIRENAPIEQGALDVNGFTVESLHSKNKQTLESLLQKFFTWIETMPDRDLAAMNAQFDYTCLKEEAIRTNLKNPLGSRTIDLHALCYTKMMEHKYDIPRSKEGESHLTTKRILAYVGLPEEPKPHIAITGARIETEAFSRLIYGKNALKEYHNFEIPPYLTK